MNRRSPAPAFPLNPRHLPFLMALAIPLASAEPTQTETTDAYNRRMKDLAETQSTASTQEATLREETLAAYNQRMKWFADAQYGMFIHFGLFSHLGGEWKGEPVPWYCEWLQASKKIPREEYATTIKEFNPRKFDADFIARTAKEAGMKYLVITSKHHEGFCLWDSKYTEFDVGSTPFKSRDILAELGKACQRHGLEFGIYYSIIDWHHPAQKPANPDGDPFGGWGQTVIEEGRKDEYIAYQTNQILELMKNYHPSMLWFDGDWTAWWTMDDGIKLYNTIRQADPNIIVNNRVAKRTGFELDFVTQEQEHFSEAFPKHWEACYTMNDSWGFKKGDNNWKSAQTVYNKLKDINEKGGNLLLNIGPDGTGVVPQESVAILRETASLLNSTPIKKAIPHITRVPNQALPAAPSRGKPVTASSQFSEPGYEAARAVDGDPKTRWASDINARTGWLEVDLGAEQEIGRVLISEIEYPETREFAIEIKEGDAWKEVARGTTIGAEKEMVFTAVKARFIRLNVTKAERPVNINEFQVFPR